MKDDQLNQFWRWIGIFCRPAICLLLGSTLAVTARPSPPETRPLRLFHTGTSEDRTLLPDDTVDPHYVLQESADGAYPGPEARIASLAGWVSVLWMEDGPKSKWISPRTDVSQGNSSGTYLYRTSVDLTGLDPKTAVIQGQWATDNEGLDIRLNGTSTGVKTLAPFPFEAFSSFAITNGFITGTNVLDFVVHQVGAGTPTGLRVELEGSAQAARSDNEPPATSPLPVSSISSPVEGAVYCPGTNLVVRVQASVTAGAVSRVELSTGTTLVGSRSSPPYDFPLNALTVGDYVLTARAFNAAGGSATSPTIHFAVSQLCTRQVAVMAPPGEADLEAVRSALLEMGVGHSEFAPSELAGAELRRYQALLWLQPNDEAAVLTDTVVGVLRQVQQQGTSLYFIGDSLLRAGANLSEANRAGWAELLHIGLDGSGTGDGWVHLRHEPPMHPVVQPFPGDHAVNDFRDPSVIGGPAQVDAEVLGTSADGDVLVAFPPEGNADIGQARTVTQLFSVGQGADEDSQRARKQLFENAVGWLLRWRPCSTYLLRLSLEAPAFAATGKEVSLILRVHHEGECEGTGIVVSNPLPAALRFLGAESTQGTIEEHNNLVTFNLNHLSSGADAVLKIRALALTAGIISNCATITGRGEGSAQPNEACARIDLRFQDGSPPVLRAQRVLDGRMELELGGGVGFNYVIESSPDLSQWIEVTQVTLDAPTLRWTEPSGQSFGQRFFRAVQQ